VFGVPEVEARLVGAGAHIVDVREPDEWRCGHIDGAHHIPLRDLMARVGEVPADREVVVVCRVGARSAQAVAWLNAQGRETVNLGGGMAAWAAAGRPMVSETGQSPYVA
jgi:rhodanese-related sulfurtransferase